jgi:ATP-dependent RNA helicase DDX46/PRP5
MVATSVCARGLDIKHIKLVINYICPNHLEDYVHRVGRTGRAGIKGTAVTFITPEECQYASDIIKALENSNNPIPDDIKKLEELYQLKVTEGEIEKKK